MIKIVVGSEEAARIISGLKCCHTMAIASQIMSVGEEVCFAPLDRPKAVFATAPALVVERVKVTRHGLAIVRNVRKHATGSFMAAWIGNARLSDCIAQQEGFADHAAFWACLREGANLAEADAFFGERVTWDAEQLYSS